MLLLVLVAVGVDRGAAWAVGRSVTAAVQLGGTDVAGAEVQIHGFPFLTQLVAGNLDHVTGSLEHGSFGGYEVTDVHLDARDVAPRSPWQARQVSAEGVVAFDTIAHVLGQKMNADVTAGPAPDQPGALTLGFPVKVLGASVDVQAVVEPTAADAALAVQVRTVSVGGLSVPVDALPGGLGAQLGGLTIPLDLPSGVTLTGVRGEQDGVRLTVEAHDVALGSLAL